MESFGSRSVEQVSTEKLQGSGFKRSEFASTACRTDKWLLKQKQRLLIDTLRHLETEKVDLENTVVDESRRQLNDEGTTSSSILRQYKFSEASVSESDDDNNERVDDAEEETDDDENAFFDTRDFLSSGSFKSNESDFRPSSFSSDDEGFFALESEDGIDPLIRSVGSNYPYIKRRKKLPDPIEKEKSVSLWSMIKDNIGKDLTKVCLPVYFNEPLSSLQKCFEDLEYSYLLDRAYEWGKQGNSLMRILNVAAFAVSGYASTEGRICKPFNPLLGETYEADYPDKGLRFFSEKVSHHPMIVACHCEGTGWKFWGDSNLKSKFWGRSIQLDPVGVLTLEFDDGEVFQWSKVTTSIYNLILGKLYCDHYGTMRIEGNREYSCKLKFKEQSIIDRNPHQVQGMVQDKHGRTVATLFGKWDESMYYMNDDFSGKGKGFESMKEAHMLWRRSKPPRFPTRYNLTRFAMTLNELTHGLKEKLPPTDSRLRPDQRYLENGEFDMANSEKLRLEQRQRQARNMQERGWKPRWFAKDKGSDTYRYVGGYWEARGWGNWDSCPDIFGQIPTDQLFD
ncbi:oxysterol-binding protein-related protein 1C-like isoform X1 [Populus alba x Populus x berolinensis]|nr:oxysterol-binding protein-related protein 1C-like isoform X1 [Populus alba x Populus x berolinensis]